MNIQEQSKPTLGITRLKSLLAFLIALIVNLVELVKDFSFAKAGSIVFELAGAKTQFDLYQDAVAEFRDLDPEESAALAAEFAEIFDIPNDRVEAYIERGLALIAKAHAAIGPVVSLVDEGRTLIREISQTGNVATPA